MAPATKKQSLQDWIQPRLIRYEVVFNRVCWGCFARLHFRQNKCHSLSLVKLKWAQPLSKHLLRASGWVESFTPLLNDRQEKKTPSMSLNLSLPFSLWLDSHLFTAALLLQAYLNLLKFTWFYAFCVFLPLFYFIFHFILCIFFVLLLSFNLIFTIIKQVYYPSNFPIIFFVFLCDTHGASDFFVVKLLELHLLDQRCYTNKVYYIIN